MTKQKPIPRKDGSRLMNDIIDALQRKPDQTADDLGEALGFGDSAVRIRLNEMLDTGVVSFTMVPGKAKFARSKLWRLTGAEPTTAAAPVAKEPSGFKERRISTRHYPSIDRRDPLVSALFGPAGRKP